MWFVRSGTKVTGPFDRDQLRAMRDLGDLSPIHQISTDRIRWESASPIVRMLDAEIPKVAATLAGASASRGVPAPSASERWFYVGPERRPIGPMGFAELQSLWQTGKIGSETLIYRDGESQWGAIGKRSEFAAVRPGRSGGALKAVAVAVCAALVVATVAGLTAWIMVSPPASTVSLASPRSDRIASLTGEDEMSRAVGLVVMCLRARLSNGAVLEVPLSNGTCFAVSSDGYLLTNLHVVQSVREKRSEENGDEVLPNLKIVESEVVPLVFFGGLRRTAEVIHRSSRFDFAVLKVERPHGGPFFSLCESSDFDRGTPVAALGFPALVSNPDEVQAAAIKQRVDQGESDLLSGGTLSAERFLPDVSYDYNHTEGNISRMSSDASNNDIILHTANISGGNSGGPLVRHDGVVVGINTQVWSRSDQAVSFGIAFPARLFRSEIEENVDRELMWSD